MVKYNKINNSIQIEFKIINILIGLFVITLILAGLPYLFDPYYVSKNYILERKEFIENEIGPINSIYADPGSVFKISTMDSINTSSLSLWLNGKKGHGSVFVFLTRTKKTAWKVEHAYFTNAETYRVITIK